MATISCSTRFGMVFSSVGWSFKPPKAVRRIVENILKLTRMRVS